MKKLVKRLTVIAAFAVAAAVSVFAGGCSTGRNGINGKDLNIFDIYEAAKAQPGKGDMTFDAFLHDYLSYDSAQLEEASSLQQAINRSLMSSVSICSYFAQTGTTTMLKSYGSGVIISADTQTGDMIVATNCHVVYNAATSDNLYYDGFATNIDMWLYGSEYVEECKISASIIATSKTHDIALLKVSESNEVKRSKVKAATFCTDEESYAGETVYAVGNANGFKMCAEAGFVSKELEEISVNLGTEAKPEQYEYSVIRVTVPITHGNSGGGLFNAGGELVGLVNAKSSAADTRYGYALPASEARRVIAKMLKSPVDGARGIMALKSGLDLIVTDAYCTGLNQSGLAEIKEVVKVSAVDANTALPFFGKLRVDDILQHLKIMRGDEVVEDLDIDRLHNFTDALISADVGDTVHITVIRGGAELTPYAQIYDGQTGLEY